jgi:hypothetical protein
LTVTQEGNVQLFCDVLAVTSTGQFKTGGCVSVTVTVNEQVETARLLVETQVVVVVPMGNNEPAGGVQVIAPHGPLVVGSG